MFSDWWEEQIRLAVEKAKRETAREICFKIIKDLPQPLQEKWKEFFAKEYGVEIAEKVHIIANLSMNDLHNEIKDKILRGMKNER